MPTNDKSTSRPSFYWDHAEEKRSQGWGDSLGEFISREDAFGRIMMVRYLFKPTRKSTSHAFGISVWKHLPSFPPFPSPLSSLRPPQRQSNPNQLPPLPFHQPVSIPRYPSSKPVRRPAPPPPLFFSQQGHGTDLFNVSAGREPGGHHPSVSCAPVSSSWKSTCYCCCSCCRPSPPCCHQ